MSASSPAPNNNKAVDTIIPSATINGIATPQRLPVFDTPKQNQRGLNKPKCIKCGNVARSRCPFQSCKNCCAKAQNPCHIHVLKQSSILPDKPPPSTAPLSEQPSPDHPSTGRASWRLSSLRQLSVTFANSLRARKPLTRKDAVNINNWRFSKLREHIEGNIEAENEAFDRYMQNVSLLEETFSSEELKPDDHPAPEPTSHEKFQKLVSSIKMKLRSNAERADICRKRIRNLVDQKLKKLQEIELVSVEDSPCIDEFDARGELKRAKKEGQWRAERFVAVNDLVDKLSKARSEDDLKSCLEIKLQLVNPEEKKVVETPTDPDSVDSVVPTQEPSSITELSYSLPKLCTVVHIDQESPSKINTQLSSLDQLGEL